MPSGQAHLAHLLLAESPIRLLLPSLSGLLLVGAPITSNTQRNPSRRAPPPSPHPPPLLLSCQTALRHPIQTPNDAVEVSRLPPSTANPSRPKGSQARSQESAKTLSTPPKVSFKSNHARRTTVKLDRVDLEETRASPFRPARLRPVRKSQRRTRKRTASLSGRVAERRSTRAVFQGRELRASRT